MSEEKHPDEVLADQIGRLLDGDDPEEVLSELAGAREVAGRECAEVLALLAYGLEPVQPRAGVRERVLAACAEKDAATGDDDGGGAATPFQRSTSTSSSQARRSRWLMALAASLVLLLLGWSVMLSVRLERQQATIARLSQHLEQAAVQQQQLVRLQGNLQRMSARLAHMTAPGVEICPLRPRGPAVQQGAWGALYLTPAADKWYFTVRDLEPCPQGRVYRIWLFVTAEKPLMVAEFREGLDTVIEIDASVSSEELSGVKVTLERADIPDVPQGPTVLFGDEKMRVL